MADPRYQVFRPANGPRHVIDPGIERIARAMCAEIAAASPGRRLPRSWRVTTDQVPPGWGVRWVVSDLPWSRFVEFGTRRRPATPVVGPVLARYRARWGRQPW